MPFHCGGRYLQLFNNNIEPSKGLIGLLLSVSCWRGKMGNGGGDVCGGGEIYDTGLVAKWEIVAPGEQSSETERDRGGKWFVVMGKHQENPLHNSQHETYVGTCVCLHWERKKKSISESHYVWFCDLKFNVAGRIARSAVLAGDPSTDRPTLRFLSFVTLLCPNKVFLRVFLIPLTWRCEIVCGQLQNNIRCVTPASIMHCVFLFKGIV